MEAEASPPPSTASFLRWNGEELHLHILTVAVEFIEIRLTTVYLPSVDTALAFGPGIEP